VLFRLSYHGSCSLKNIQLLLWQCVLKNINMATVRTFGAFFCTLTPFGPNDRSQGGWACPCTTINRLLSQECLEMEVRNWK